jgi:hypothetical protein
MDWSKPTIGILTFFERTIVNLTFAGQTKTNRDINFMD